MDSAVLAPWWHAARRVGRMVAKWPADSGRAQRVDFRALVPLDGGAGLGAPVGRGWPWGGPDFAR
jgi:hypothetical protein